MTNEHNCHLSEALRLSERLNLCLNDYYRKTEEISTVIASDDEESMSKVDELVNQRETIIVEYNLLKTEYELTKEAADNRELVLLEEQRSGILKSIRDMESNNLAKTNELYNLYKDKIKEINNSKKAINAYSHKSSLSDGFFVDKRK